MKCILERIVYLLSVLVIVSAKRQSDRPLVLRPKTTRKYKTVLTVDGGAFRVLLSSAVAVEIEDAIKRYLLDHPKHLPKGAKIKSETDFDILLADFFDGMAGVSAGSWATAYLASKGGNGVAAETLNRPSIVRRYGSILPGGARGLEVFFLEYARDFYPGTFNIAIRPPSVTREMLRRGNATGRGRGRTTFTDLTNRIQIPGLNSAFYPVGNLEKALRRFLGDVKLSELSTYYSVNAYDLIRRQNIYFVHDTTPKRGSVTFTAHPFTRNAPRALPDGSTVYEPDNEIQELDFLMRDLVRGSSALPSFHEAKTTSPVGMTDVEYALIDGSLISNNPTLQILIFLTSAPRPIPLENIAVISLGSGGPLLDLDSNRNNAALGWLLNFELLSILLEGTSEHVAQQVDFLFYGNPKVKANQYLRIQTFHESNTTEGEALNSMPDEEHLPLFLDLGRELAEQYKEVIDHFVEEFIFA